MGVQKFIRRERRQVKYPSVIELNYLYNKLPTKYSSVYTHVKLAAKVARNIAEQLHEIGAKVDVELAQKMAFAHSVFKHLGMQDSRVAQNYLARRGYARLAKGIGMIRSGVSEKSLNRMSLEEKILAFADYSCRGIKRADGGYEHRVYSLKDAYEVVKEQNKGEGPEFLEREYNTLKAIEDELVRRGANMKNLPRIR